MVLGWVRLQASCKALCSARAVECFVVSAMVCPEDQFQYDSADFREARLKRTLKRTAAKSGQRGRELRISRLPRALQGLCRLALPWSKNSVASSGDSSNGERI